MSQPCHITPEKFPERDCYGMRGNTEPTQPRSADGIAAPEPSGDDTLTEILTKLYAEGNSRGRDGVSAENMDTLPLAEARTQLLQYIEGEVIGPDATEYLDGKDIGPNHLQEAVNRRLAEQRQRLRGEG